MSALCLLVVCSGCGMPSERSVYDVACNALEKDTRVPATAKPHRRGKSSLWIAKNAACVEIPYDYTAPSGEKATGHYTVWCKRIARRWELDRAFPTPTYE